MNRRGCRQQSPPLTGRPSNPFHTGPRASLKRSRQFRTGTLKGPLPPSSALLQKSFLGFFYPSECPPFGFPSVFPPHINHTYTILSPTPFPTESRARVRPSVNPFPFPPGPPSNSRGSTRPRTLPLALPSCCSPLQCA
ncbi:hypothetical protein GE21DRAFT_1135823 [Neurospora crassa]|nr:hypothetical protein GE21DRAFT_1027053 [Neurospora crassa]KHE81721.1 hypothetical protein GE21DRAFT_1135823 [Neurospora crassa]